MSKWGGAREGAGRKKLFNEPVTIGFIIEKDDKEKLAEKYGNKLREMFREWVNDLLNEKEHKK